MNTFVLSQTFDKYLALQISAVVQHDTCNFQPQTNHTIHVCQQFVLQIVLHDINTIFVNIQFAHIFYVHIFFIIIACL